MEELEAILEANRRYAERFEHGGLAAPPARRLAVVTCMDARLDVEAMLGLRPGDAHILRNAGGVVTDDVIRSLVVSQRLLGTRVVLLIHHTGCGMLALRDDDLRRQIEAEVGIRPPFAFDAFADLEADLRQSVARIQASPFLPYKEEVYGLVYDVDSGRLRRVV
ncbi:MAG: carbonic anhydrase [Clostridia bacterium]|nr:carbonic anhydrase [Clostridia bacterium]MCL6521525.1 carbonic anhydrase [Bacillota bacterium]